MTEQEFEEFMEMFGNKIPNPEHYPQAFMYYVRMYKFLKGYYK